MIQVDIPQLAYKTYCLEYRVYDNDGNRMPFVEAELEEDLKETLSGYPYSNEHDHVR